MAQPNDAPASNSEIRARAVAQLQRATSLSRLQNGRRPSPSTANSSAMSSRNPSDDESWEGGSRRMLEPRSAQQPGSNASEFLNTPSRAYPPSSFDPSQVNPSPYTPHDLTAYTRTPDSQAQNLEANGTRGNSPTPVGRSTPSPLPSLGELRQLQRANSAAGRLVAMKKLMGEQPPSPQSLQRAGSLNSPEVMMSPSKRRRQRATEDDSSIVSPSKTTLARSYTVGNGGGQERRSVIGRKMMQRLGNRTARGPAAPAAEVPQDQLGETSAQMETVDIVHSGQVTPEREENENADQPGHPLPNETNPDFLHLTQPSPTDDGQDVLMPPHFPSSVHLDSPIDPFMQHPRSPNPEYYTSLGLPPPSPARAASRMTDVSGDEAFEYEGHLRRSMSEKERKVKFGKESVDPPQDSTDEMLLTPKAGAVETVPELPATTIGRSMINPADETPQAVQQEFSARKPAEQEGADTSQMDLLPPLAPFSTGHHSPSGHVQNLSGDSTNSASYDPMSKIPFMLASGFSPQSSGRTRQFGNRIGRDESMASFPRAVGEGDGTGSIVWSAGKETPITGTPPPAPSQTSRTWDHPVDGLPDSPASAKPTPRPSHTRSGSAFREHFDAEETDRIRGVPEGPMATPGSAFKGDMSWEEVGGLNDREVPTDVTYQKKVDGVVGKIERTIRGTFKRRESKEESDALNSAPLDVRVSRSSSVTGSVSSHSHGPGAFSAPGRPAPARNGSLTSSILSNTPSTVLEPGQASPMPQADSSDPRFQNSKLCPAPGVLPPPLLQQASDSAIPSLQNSARSMSSSSISNQSLPAGSGAGPSGLQAAYYDLPPRSPSPIGGGSVGKKSWLAEAFFAPTGNNFLQKRRPSINDMLKRKASRSGNGTSPSDGNPTPPLGQTSPNPELSPNPNGSHFVDVGSQAYSVGPPSSQPPRVRVDSPVMSSIIDEDDPLYTPPSALTGISASSAKGSPVDRDFAPHMTQAPKAMSVRSQEVMKKLDKVLAMMPDDPDRPDVLDDPPRRLVLCSPVLQVVNGHTVKDRFLFLFSDLLVIAKPLSEDDTIPELDGHFMVKSVVALDGLKLAPMAAEDKAGNEPASRHPVVGQFINSFLRNPTDAVAFLTERSQLQGDHATLASLLFKTPELDKEQLGLYLARSDNILLLRAFIDRFHFTGVKIHEALRMFLLSIRLPSETSVSEVVLHALADRWHHANKAVVTFDKDLSASLILAIMQLNDALNPGSGFGSFAFPNQVISPDDFVAAFKSKDSQGLVPTELLQAVFKTVRKERLVQALPRAQSPQLREVLITPARLPTRLTYNVWSDKIYISIPRADSRFGIRLQGEGLVFDPPFLDFTESTEESFRVMGTSLGARSLLFSRMGTNAPLYANLANTKTFVVERSFMRHTFQISFSNHLDVKRKYCFSLENADTKDTWYNAIAEHAQRTRRAKGAPIPAGIIPPAIKLATEAISLKVLQTSLIAEENEESAGPTRPPLMVRGSSQTQSGSHGFPGSSSSMRGPSIVRQMTGRRVSVAKIMQPVNQPSAPPLRPRQGSKTSSNWNLGPSQQEEPADREGLPPKAQTGKDIVLICRQNSLLPVVMAFLHAGLDDGSAAMVEGGSANTASDHGDQTKQASVDMHRAMTMV